MNPAEAYIRQVVKREELGHAYLFEAARDEAAEAAMRKAAQVIACREHTGCGRCDSCRALASGNHPDIISLTREKEAYSVREIREQLVGDIGIRPYRFDHKIYLIPRAQSLSPLCQNVMLKTLEEPPSYGIILLAANNRNVFLPTVLSRLVCLSAEEAETGEIKEPREGRDGWLSFLSRIRSASALDCMGLSAALAREGLDTDSQLKEMEGMLRELYLHKAGVRRGLRYPEAAQMLKEYAENLSDENLSGLWKRLDTAKKQVKSNVKAESALGLFCMDLRDALRESEEI